MPYPAPHERPPLPPELRPPLDEPARDPRTFWEAGSWVMSQRGVAIDDEGNVLVTNLDDESSHKVDASRLPRIRPDCLPSYALGRHPVVPLEPVRPGETARHFGVQLRMGGLKEVV